MAGYDLAHYDGVLAFGAAVREVYLREGWAARAWTWHEAADHRVFRDELFAEYKAKYPQEADSLERIQRRELPEGWDADLPSWNPGDKAVATRKIAITGVKIIVSLPSDCAAKAFSRSALSTVWTSFLHLSASSLMKT